MNDLLHMGSALYNYINTNGTVTTYFQKASQSGNTPYCLIQFMMASDDYTFTDRGVKGDYQIKIVSSKNFPEESIRLYGSIHDIIQDANLTLPGFDVIRIRRESLFSYEDQDHFWNIGGIYNLETWQQ